MQEADCSVAPPESSSTFTEKDTKRFLKKVQKSEEGCWIWMAGKNKKGYGIFSVGYKTLSAHRSSWLIHNGPIPDGLQVLHNCPCGDNSSCVNPAHLWLGTQNDNIRDRDMKQRQARGANHGSRTRPDRLARGDRHGFHIHPESPARGERVGSAKLTEENVISILKMHASGFTKSALSREFGVHRRTIGRIVQRKIWRHIPHIQ